MRVLQVIPYFSRRMGGDVSVCSNLSINLRASGHEVTICTSSHFDQDLARGMMDQGVEFVPHPTTASFSGLLFTPRMKGWIQSNLKNFDIIHLQGYRSYQSNVVSKHARRIGAPLILQPHGTFPRIVERKVVKALYDVAWGNKIVSRSTRIIAVSEFEARQLISLGIDAGRIEVIPNGVEVDRFAEIPQYGQFRTSHGLGQGKILLYMGRVHASKGLDTLLDAFATVIGKGVDCRLVIAGSDGGYGTHLRRRATRLAIASQIDFVGHIDRTAEAYADADVVVYPGPYEIFGLVPFEAMMCLAPVIVSEGTGCGELVRSYGLGQTFPTGRSDLLATSIIRALQHPDEAKREAAEGRSFVTSHLNWKRITTRFIDIYKSSMAI